MYINVEVWGILEIINTISLKEFGLLNINYTFNPYIDVENDTLTTEALVKLINSVWILLRHYKNVAEKTERLEERNHVLESNNSQLNVSIKL